MTDAAPKTVTIDGEDYDLDALSEEARKQMIGLQLTEQEMRRLQQQLAILQTARTAYANALKAELLMSEG
jgi:hypothetical protein